MGIETKCVSRPALMPPPHTQRWFLSFPFAFAPTYFVLHKIVSSKRLSISLSLEGFCVYLCVHSCIAKKIFIACGRWYFSLSLPLFLWDSHHVNKQPDTKQALTLACTFSFLALAWNCFVGSIFFRGAFPCTHRFIINKEKIAKPFECDSPHGFKLAPERFLALGWNN